MLTLSRWKVALVLLAIVLGLLFAAPNVIPADVRAKLPGFMPKQTLNLGLDLQGGSHLLFEVDTVALRNERLTNIVEDVRTQLSDEKIASSQPAVVNGGVEVRITNPADIEKAARQMRNTLGAPLQGSAGGRDVTVSLEPDQKIRVAFVADAIESEGKRAVEQSIEIIRRRVDELGTREPNITPQGTNRIVVEAPGESDPEKLVALVGQTAKLTFQMVDENADPAQAAQGRVPPGDEILQSGDNYAPFYVVKRRALVTGEMLTSAQQQFDPQTNRPVVAFRFNGIGARKFGEATTHNVGKRFAIVLDKKVISAPSINQPITGGSGQIYGNFTVESANNLSILLRAGALPAPLKVEMQQTVSAELGADSIRAGTIAGIVGLAGVVVFMIAVYGVLFGGISIIALAVNGILIIAAMSMTQATLTLPGIAGLILTLAVAVDANVLIYERMRDELRAGRTLVTAMDAGFARALGTILDANMTHMLSAAIMFIFGSGPVKGFAWTLSIGVITTVFTAVLITQVLLAWWYRTVRPKTLPIA
jgi:preprotein translocase subunit SecD